MSISVNKINIFIDGLFERLLRILLPKCYPLQPIFVEKAVENAITENTKVFKNGILPPNKITVFLNREDHVDLKKMDKIFRSQLEKTAASFMQKELNGHAIGITYPVISITVSPDMIKGDFRVEAEYYEHLNEANK